MTLDKNLDAVVDEIGFSHQESPQAVLYELFKLHYFLQRNKQGVTQMLYVEPRWTASYLSLTQKQIQLHHQLKRC